MLFPLVDASPGRAISVEDIRSIPVDGSSMRVIGTSTIPCAWRPPKMHPPYLTTWERLWGPELEFMFGEDCTKTFTADRGYDVTPFVATYCTR